MGFLYLFLCDFLFTHVMFLFSYLTLGFFISKGIGEQLKSSMIGSVERLLCFVSVFLFCLSVRTCLLYARTLNIDQRLVERFKKGLNAYRWCVRGVAIAAFVAIFDHFIIETEI